MEDVIDLTDPAVEIRNQEQPNGKDEELEDYEYSNFSLTVAYDEESLHIQPPTASQEDTKQLELAKVVSFNGNHHLICTKESELLHISEEIQKLLDRQQELESYRLELTGKLSSKGVAITSNHKL